MTGSKRATELPSDDVSSTEIPPVESVVADEAIVPPSPAEAARHLKDTLGRAWVDARETVRDVGETWRRSASNVGAETRHAASETRDTLGDALGGMGELGEGIAGDTIDLARSVGFNLEGYVRRNPVRAVAIAAASGALLALLLRRR